jgi:hypothetical protein
MHEGVDRFELAPCRRAVERHDDTRDRARSEANANEVPWQKVEAIGDEVAERARGPAHTREDRDLRGPGRHRS